jgi:DNA-binding transcriptional LysR family regulator
VGLPPSTAVHTLLQRSAAKVGRLVSYRVIVSNFDAAFRAVAANLGVSVIPMEVGGTIAANLRLRMVPLSDAWARRNFVVCFQRFQGLQPASQQLVEHLVARAATDRRE